MPRKPKPSFELMKIIWDIAATIGTDNIPAIVRQLDYELEKLRNAPEEHLVEDTPDERTIKRIIEEDINEMTPEAVLAKLPPHVWHLRDDYEAIKQLAEGGSQASQKEIDPLVAKAQEEHLGEIRALIEKWHAAVDEYMLDIFEMDKIRLGPHHIPLRLDWVILDHLFESLKQHLPIKDLWQAHSEWCDKFEHYWYMCYKVKEDATNQGKMWPNVQIRKRNFAMPIIYQIYHLDVGWEPYDLNFRRQGKSLHVDGTCFGDPSDTFHYSILTAEHPEDYIERYKSLVNNILKSEEVDNLLTLEWKLSTNQRRVESKLQEILLRRDYVGHTCRLCPRQAGLSH